MNTDTPLATTGRTPAQLMLTAPSPPPAGGGTIQFSSRPPSVMTSMTVTPQMPAGDGKSISVSPANILPEDYEEEEEEEDDDDDDDDDLINKVSELQLEAGVDVT
jgi:hypothetical protein